MYCLLFKGTPTVPIIAAGYTAEGHQAMLMLMLKYFTFIMCMYVYKLSACAL